MPRALPAPVSRALRHPRWSEADARLVLDALASSGLPLAQFAREHAIDPQRLYAWRRRIAPTPPRPQRAPEPIAFVRLGDAVATPNAARYEIVLTTGELLRIEGDLHAPSLAALLGVLRAERTC